MKKILIGFSVFLMTLVSAQNYPDYYPTNNSNYYGDEDDSYYFPDDYYYEYPSDYYNNDLYQGYYNDYRQSIYNVNWNRFFAMHRLSPWQVQQIMMLNDSFPSYNAWNSFYRYNPDRWYYDRFYAMQRILGPNLFIVFQNNYYNGYNPVVYYQNYNRRHYARNIYVIPRYRSMNINVYKVNKVEYHQTNPRQNIGFQPVPRSGRTDNSFRNEELRTDNNTRDNNFRTENAAPRNNGIRSENLNTRNNSVRTPLRSAENNGIRNNSNIRKDAPRNEVPTRKVERTPENRSNQNNESRTPSSSSRNSGQRFTTR